MVIHRIRAGLFFVLFYLYIWLRIDPGLLYHAQEPVFFWSSAFSQDFWGYPGGWVEYLSSFLSQSYYYSWAGALLITSIAWFIFLLTRAFITSVGGTHYQVISLVPAILLLVLHNHYRYPLSADIALLLSLLCVVVYVKTALNRASLRFFTFLVLSVFLYYAAAAPYLLFSVLCGIFELLIQRRRLLGAACFLCIPVIIHLAAYVFQISFADTCARSLPFYRAFQLYGETRLLTASIAFYLFFPLTAFWEALRQRSVGNLSRVHEPPASPTIAKPLKYSRRSKILHTLFFPVVAIIPAFLSFDGNSKTLLQIDYYAQHKKWRQVIEETDHLREYNTLAIYNIQRALYHLGQLPERMFSFNLIANAPIFLPTPEGNAPLNALSDILLELGEVNQAEHMAHEALEILGERPSILQRLVLINILKGRIQAARTFLGLLDKTLLYRNWAERYRHALETDSLSSIDKELAQIRSFMFRTDFPGYLAPEVLLELLLEQNGQNRMAFEYLMAHYLLNGQLDKIAANVGRLNDFPDRFAHPTIPQHYEEAILLYMMKIRSQQGKISDLPLHGRKIRPHTLQRFGEFNNLLAAHRDDMAVARKELGKTHGNTYWYYFVFRDSLPAPAAPPFTQTTNPQQ